MIRTEIAAMLAYAARLDPRTVPASQAEADDRTDQWLELLADVPGQAARGWDVAAIIRKHIASSPYPILPADIARAWTAHRRDAMGRHHDPLPAADPDNPQLWTAELRATRHAVAAGQTEPAPLLALTAGTRDEREQQAAAVLAGLGFIPRGIRDQIAPRTRTILNGQAADGPERLPRAAALAVDCPRADCRAQRYTLCKRPSGKELHKTVHPQRQDVYAAALAAQEAS